MTSSATETTRAGIVFALVGMFCISLNDALIKFLSDGYPLHQIVFARSFVAIAATSILIRFEGSQGQLWPRDPGLQLLRALLIVFANMFFFASLAILPLATATAVFFVAPLLITLFAIPVLGEKVGLWRFGAIVVGLLGVIVISGGGWRDEAAPFWAYSLPVLGALCYAGMAVLTRKLSTHARASALAFYMQAMFIVVSALFWVVAGDGRFASGLENESLIFLLRAWVWPTPGDLFLLFILGCLAGVVGFSVSKAYGLAPAATISSFEYSALAMSILWGLVIFGTFPGVAEWTGIAMIAGAGLVVFFREHRRQGFGHAEIGRDA